MERVGSGGNPISFSEHRVGIQFRSENLRCVYLRAGNETFSRPLSDFILSRAQLGIEKRLNESQTPLERNIKYIDGYYLTYN